LKKGRSVFIEGRLQLDTWEDKQSGQKRSKLRVVGENMQFLGSKPGGTEGEEPRAVTRAAGKSDQGSKNTEPELQPEEDDIPF
jgi:single-strand DNA-binding protein